MIQAQVMRLSALYALLDCSSMISVEHHRAAMALWDYCERSARWIFGTNTGDRNADKLYCALRQSGRGGHDSNQDQRGCFQTESRQDSLDNALRLLHRSSLAQPVMEATGARSG
jgi:hypothetical protein